MKNAMTGERSPHAVFMHRALELAARGKGWVSPNPCVGAVIVNRGRIVGEGYHARFGGPHAEVTALAKAGSLARGGTLYVTLEPCVHWGKTPPCAPAVIDSGLKTVYVASKDPNPVVAGRGIRALRRAGIKVQAGLEAAAADRLNRPYLTWRNKRRPYVVLKSAMSLDGKIATQTGESKWITGPAARHLGHRLRAESDAILVGATTVDRDDPELTSHSAGRNPLRVVLDPRLRLATDRRLFRTQPARTVLVTGLDAAPAKAELLRKRGVQILRVPLKFKRIEIKTLLKTIAKMGVSQLLVEGGGETSWGFVREGLVDEAYVFVAPLLLGGRTAPTPVTGAGFARLRQAARLPHLSATRVGTDVVLHAQRHA